MIKRDFKSVCSKLSKKHVLRSIKQLQYIPKGTIQKDPDTGETQPLEHDILVGVSMGEDGTGKYVAVSFDGEEYLTKNGVMKKAMDYMAAKLRESWEKSNKKWSKV
jgi:hypothetical protein